MTAYPGEIPSSTTQRHHEAYTKTNNDEVAMRVIQQDAGASIPDPRVVDRFHTSAAGVITEITETTTYLITGLVDTIVYTDATGAPFVPTGTVSINPIKISLGQQVLAVTDAAVVALTVPVNTASAYIQNHEGVSIKISSTGTDPVVGVGGVGYILNEEDEVKLFSLDEVNKFRAIAVDNSAPGEIYVEFFNL